MDGLSAVTEGRGSGARQDVAPKDSLEPSTAWCVAGREVQP